ncbi:MAG: hypothetical protein KF887_04115 [Paracoccaceae bacterium]|nr:MAG: hypothetical protein KF887_04115 [Paracoccaceae bacterium]
MRALLVLTAVPLIAACTVEPPPTPAPDACGAAALQDLVGQPASALAAMTFAAPTRVLRPGMAVTMDYREDRLNIEINATERVARVFCG